MIGTEGSGEPEEAGEPRPELPAIEGFTDLVEIGRGGFSVVYSATQVDFGRRVAVKVLDVSGAEARQIEREARAIGRIADLPHVVQAHQVTSTTDGRPVLVMALMPTSLGALVRTSGPVSPADTARWAGQLTRALAGAHHLEVFHRDIKPENVLISTYGDAYLADFGISAVSSLQTGTTTMQSLSPVHAPPERLAGATDSDRVGDIYSLASTIFTALVGHAPFGTTTDGGVYGLMERVVKLPLPTDERIVPGVHEVLAIAMAKDPQLRYRSVEQFGTTLAVAFGTPIAAHDLDTGRRLQHPPPPPPGHTAADDNSDHTRLKAPIRPSQASDSFPPAPPDEPAVDHPGDMGAPAAPAGTRRRRGALTAAGVAAALVILGGAGALTLAWATGSPTDPVGASEVVGGRSHTCALLLDESVSCWGANWFGQLGSGAPPRPAASAAEILAATKRDDTNVSQEWTTEPTPVTGLKRQQAITAGRNHTCVLGEDKRVRCWGSNSYGQLGTAEDAGPDAVPPGGAWRAKPAVVQGLEGVEQISAGADFTCAVVEDRSVLCWGINWSNQLGDPALPPGIPVDGAPTPDRKDSWSPTPVRVTGLGPAVSISAGGFHVCALLDDAQVACWGDTARGQLGSSLVQIAGNGRQPRTPYPVVAELNAPAVQVSAGRWHTCAVMEDGQAMCWGENRFGQLGNPRKRGPDDANSYVTTPVSAVGVTNARRLAAGANSTCALLDDGSAVCFGSDEWGQLGSGPEDQRPERWTDDPERVQVVAPMSAIAIGANHACGIAENAVLCWGANGAGQVGTTEQAGEVVGGVDSPTVVRGGSSG